METSRVHCVVRQKGELIPIASVWQVPHDPLRALQASLLLR